MFQTKVVEEIKTHVLCSIYIYIYINHAIYVVMWKNVVEPDGPHDNTAHSPCMLDT